MVKVPAIAVFCKCSEMSYVCIFAAQLAGPLYANGALLSTKWPVHHLAPTGPPVAER